MKNYIERNWRELILLGLIVYGYFVTGCAHTEFWYQGEKIARFEGDMRRSNFTMIITAEGVRLEWTADAVSHSEATRAQGDAGAAKIAAGASLVTAATTAALLAK